MIFKGIKKKTGSQYFDTVDPRGASFSFGGPDASETGAAGSGTGTFSI